MKLPQQSQDAFIHISPLMWQEFRQAMLNARQDREEVIGFLFCQRHQLSKKKLRYIPVNWVVPTPDCYEHQSENGLVLKQSFHQYILDTYLKDQKNRESSINSLDVVHVHTHFGDAAPSFSTIDDLHEAEYARFLSFCYRNQPRLISGVFNESLDKSQFRIWDRRGISPTSIEFYNSWFIPLNKAEDREPQIAEDSIKSEFKDRVQSIFDSDTRVTERELSHGKNGHFFSDLNNGIFARQEVFGDGVQQQLGQLKVALIGCGGIGAVFAEQLARLGVKHWILIDPDRLETVNLNRMPGATQQMVDQWWYKVHYIKWLIKRAYTIGSHVRTLPISVEEESAKAEIMTADLIVVATDNHKSRQIAQELALKYVRPLICLGTHIEIKPNERPRLYTRVTVPPLGGGWCLMCGNVINLQQAALESAPTEIMDVAQQAGYIKGIDDPAVYWLNSLCASTGVGIIHGMLAGFLDVDAGLDWVCDFPNSQWLKTNTKHLHSQDCYFCTSELPKNSSQEIVNDFKEDLLFSEAS